jgi:hypothetical protein
LDQQSTSRRDLYLTTHNIYDREISIPSAGFEPAIPARDRPQTLALDRSTTGISKGEGKKNKKQNKTNKTNKQINKESNKQTPTHKISWLHSALLFL